MKSLFSSSSAESREVSKSSKKTTNKADDESDSQIPDFLRRFFSDLKTSSKAKQLTVGAISGWAAGYVASKFGKFAATALGGSLLLIQVCL